MPQISTAEIYYIKVVFLSSDFFFKHAEKGVFYGKKRPFLSKKAAKPPFYLIYLPASLKLSLLISPPSLDKKSFTHAGLVFE